MNLLQDGWHARHRLSAVRDVQLPIARTAGAGGPSAAGDPTDHRQGPEATIPLVFADVFACRATLHPAREIAAGPAVSGSVYGPQGAGADAGFLHQASLPVDLVLERERRLG